MPVKKKSLLENTRCIGPSAYKMFPCSWINKKQTNWHKTKQPISLPKVSDTEWCRNAQCDKVTIGSNTVCCTDFIHRVGRSFVHATTHRLRCKLLVECQLDPLNVVAKLDGWSQLQIHTLLHGGEVEQQQSLSINLLRKTSCTQHSKSSVSFGNYTFFF